MDFVPPETLQWAEDMGHDLRLLATLERRKARLDRTLRDSLSAFGSIDDILSMHLSTVGMDDIDPTIDQDKAALATAMYRGMGFRYSFLEMLRTGNYAPWPHELSAVACASMALANYIAADELGLSPRLFEFTGLSLGGSAHGGHSLVTVDVGQEKPWIVDRAMGLLGPLDWEANVLEATKVRSGERMTLPYDDCIELGPGDIERRMEYQRSPEGAASMLRHGQRLGTPSIDTWKTERPGVVELFLRYRHQIGELVTMMGTNRPFVQNRAVQYVTSLDLEKEAMQEGVVGMLFSESGWAKFFGTIPMVTLFPEEAARLIGGVSEMSVEQQVAFEQRLMQIAQGTVQDSFWSEALDSSYTRTRGTPFAGHIDLLSTVEAVYQEAAVHDGFAYDNDQRDTVLNRFRSHPQIRAHFEAKRSAARAADRAKRARRRALGRESRATDARSFFRALNRIPQEFEDVRHYFNLRSEAEMLGHLLAGRARFYYEGLDRFAFIQTQIVPHGTSLGAVQQYGQERFGLDPQVAIKTGYARFFAEFMGHMAYSLPLLRLDGYREDVLAKVRSYRP